MLDRLNGVPSSKPFVHVILERELLERIDDFRYTMRIPSRNAAIRWLLTAALDQSPIPEPDWEKYGTIEGTANRDSKNLFDPPPPPRKPKKK